MIVLTHVFPLLGLDTKKIENVLKKKLSINTNSKKKLSPGLFPLHYSPGIPLRTNVKKPKKDEAYLLIKKRKSKLKNYRKYGGSPRIFDCFLNIFGFFENSGF